MDKESFVTLFIAGLQAVGCDDTLCSEWADAATPYIEKIDDADFSEKFKSPDSVEKLIDKIIVNPETALDEFFAEQKTDTDDGELKAEALDYTKPDEAYDADFDDPVLENTDTQVFDVNELAEEIKIDKKKIKSIKEDQKPSKNRKYVKGTPLFYVLLVLTAPLWIPIWATVWILFGAAYLAVSLLIASFVAAMVVIIGIGTALSLIGIIYGVINIFSVMPIGLFEIGLGIVLAGVTMLLSILIYNFAVRLIPKLYSLITRFAKFTAGGISNLYYNAKRECGRK